MTSMTLEKKVAKLFIQRKKTLAIAESCTGGLLSHRLTNIPGSSGFFKLGMILYANDAKIKLLKIPQNIIHQHGAVSPQTAKLMAEKIRKILNCDIGIGITGIAGPTGQTKNKPLGLVYIALGAENRIICRKFIFKGNRRTIKLAAATEVLKILLKFV